MLSSSSAPELPSPGPGSQLPLSAYWRSRYEAMTRPSATGLFGTLSPKNQLFFENKSGKSSLLLDFAMEEKVHLTRGGRTLAQALRLVVPAPSNTPGLAMPRCSAPDPWSLGSPGIYPQPSPATPRLGWSGVLWRSPCIPSAIAASRSPISMYASGAAPGQIAAHADRRLLRVVRATPPPPPLPPPPPPLLTPATRVATTITITTTTCPQPPRAGTRRCTERATARECPSHCRGGCLVHTRPRPTPFTSHSHPIHTRFTAHSHPIRIPSTLNSHPIHSPFTAHSHPIHSPFTAHSQPIHCPFTAHSHPIHTRFTASSQPIHSPFARSRARRRLGLDAPNQCLFSV